MSYNMYIYNFKYLPKNVDAMVLFPFTLTRFSKEDMPVSLRRHEEVHYKQAIRGLVVFFYIAYVWEYLKGRIAGLDHKQAYLLNPFEIEAREAE